MLRKLCQQGIDVLKFRESICHSVSIDKEPVKVNARAQSKRNHFTSEWIWNTNKLSYHNLSSQKTVIYNPGQDMYMSSILLGNIHGEWCNIWCLHNGSFLTQIYLRRDGEKQVVTRTVVDMKTGKSCWVHNVRRNSHAIKAVVKHLITPNGFVRDGETQVW